MSRPPRAAVRAVAIGAVVVLTAGATWFVAQRAESPAARSARQEPPPPSVITVPVSEKRLTVRDQLGCDVAPRGGQRVRVGAPAWAGDPVVTGRPLDDGDTVNEGTVLIEISGRPVIALAGLLPMYRDLTVGDVGPDVDQFESALSRLGLLSSSLVGGPLTADTAIAADRLLTSAGYPPSSTPSGDSVAEGTENDAENDAEADTAGSDGGAPVIAREEFAYVSTLPGVIRTSGLALGSTPGRGSLSVARPGLEVRCEVTRERATELARAIAYRTTTSAGDDVSLTLSRTEHKDAATDGEVPSDTLVLAPDRSAGMRRGPATVDVVVDRAPDRGLVVPVTALWRDSAGRDVVTVGTGGSSTDVRVRVVFQGPLEAQVEAVDGDLTAGDAVQVARDGG